jgi:hypothetical protein
VQGSWEVDTVTPNTAHATTDTISNIAVANAGEADVVISADAALPPSLTTFAAGLIFRYVDISNYWQLVILNGNLEIHEISAGGDTTRDATAVSGLASTTVTFSVTTSGSSISGSCGGFNVSFSSSQHASATKHGMIQYLNSGASYLPASWDNFLTTGGGAGGGGKRAPTRRGLMGAGL